MSLVTRLTAGRWPAAAIAGLVFIGCADLNVPKLGRVASVVVSPDTVVLLVGDTGRVLAFPLDSAATLQGQKMPTWASSAPSVVTVDDTGLVVARGAGGATITATVEGVIGRAVVAVTGSPAAITVSAGNGQSAAVNSAVAVPPTVRVTDAGGLPVPLVSVTFAVTGGGGTVAPATPVLTNFNGLATAAWTLGPSPGANTMSVTAAGAGVAGSPVAFTATATVGPPSAAQSAIAANPTTIAPSTGQSFSTITVTVRDSAGSTITGATVTLSATGSGNVLSQPTDTTNAQGRTTGAISSNVAETKTISATVNGTVTLTQTATVTVSTSATAGLGVSTQPAGAVSNQAFVTQPVVDIRDAFGNRVMASSDPVTVTLISGNGTLVGTTTVNAVAGRATFSGLRIRGTRLTGDTIGTGPHLLQFSSPGFSAVLADTLPVGVSFAYNVQDVFGRNGCSGCHGNTHAFWLGVTTMSCAGATRIIPGDTTNSAVYAKIKTATPPCGAVMPTSGLMSLVQIRLIRDWILQGALNN